MHSASETALFHFRPYAIPNVEMEMQIKVPQSLYHVMLYCWNNQNEQNTMGQ